MPRTSTRRNPIRRSTRSTTAPSGPRRITSRRRSAGTSADHGVTPGTLAESRTRPVRGGRTDGSAWCQRSTSSGSWRAPAASRLTRSRTPRRGGPGTAQSPGPGGGGGACGHDGGERLGEPLQRRLDPEPRRERGPGPAEAHLDGERARRPVGVEPRVDHEVGEVRRPGRVQEHGAGDAAVPPLVLVLDERGVRPLHDGQPERVRTRLQDAREVELRRQVRVLADADVHAVDATSSTLSAAPTWRTTRRPSHPAGSSNERS